MSPFDATKEAEEILGLWGEAAERIAIRKARWSAEEGNFEKASEWWEIQRAIRDIKSQQGAKHDND